MRKSISFSVLIIIFAVLANSRSVFANPIEEVLGYSSNNDTFPQITAGTGYLLPDSPFYFVDKAFQRLKLSLAFFLDEKAIVQTQILGERMAELKVMYEAKNTEGINTALLEIEREAKNLAQNLKKAAMDGNDVSIVAKQANDALKDYRLVLATVAKASDDQLSFKLESASYVLLLSKLDIENYLNTADQEEAIASDLEIEVENAVLGTSTKAQKAEQKIQKLEKRAQKAAQLEQKKLDAKKLQAKQLAQRKLIEEKRKKLSDERKKKLEAAKEALKKVREAALRFKEAQNAEKQLKQTEQVED
ncbi:MAG: hypothetical protein HY344_03600 [Candidatus Levybacteria bacterium]|nr:hypothetical protein [Candidatus Levybacteria bacterium]